MKKFFGLILFIFLIGLNQCYAAKYSFLVLPNDLFINQKEYLVFQQSAHVISTDIINYYNQHSEMSAVPINQVKTYLEKPENYRLKKDVQKFLTEYQNNYIIDYSIVQKLANIFGAKQVLLMTCNMDAQNYITRRTMWDFLDVPGATVIDPAYRLSTQVTLIDPNNQVILWQHNYQKLISSRENRIIPTTYNAGNEQLEKVKKYSTKFLAPQIVQETQLALKNLSPYQDLNLYPEIVKPDYVSIDKVKIDSKRGMVRSGNYIKKQSALAGATVAAESAKLAKKGSAKAKGLIAKIKDKIQNKSLLKTEENQLSIDEQIELMKQKEQAKLEQKQAQQRLKYEMQLQKQQLNAVKKEMQQEAKLQLQKQKEELQNKYQPAVEETVKNTNVVEINNNQEVKKKSFSLLNKIKNAKQNNSEPQVEINVETPSIPVITQPELRNVPYIRTKPVLRESDYTINDY
ncbi:cell envelope integrity protein TolA [bacterium]|nr:cell envelope integrity protein TolA [bacterium]